MPIDVDLMEQGLSRMQRMANSNWRSKSWRAGTLSYTPFALGKLFFWLLLGDFAATIAATALPMMLPVYLDQLSYSKNQIAWFMGMGNLAAMIIGPLTGMWSDRLRTRWGRRRPFVLFTAPIAAVGMFLIPFVHNFWALNVAVMLVSFANAVGIIGFYLYNDVIPGELMGRFVGAFRIVGFLGALGFQYGLYRFFDTNPTMVWLTVGSISVLFNILMLLMVKEGQYDPPPPREPLLNNVKLFIKEGFTSPFLWMLWLTLGMTALGGPAANFFILFFKDNIHLNSQQIGQMMGAGTVLAMVMAYPCGWLVDRFGPRLVWLLAGFAVALAQLAMYRFIHDQFSCFVLYMIYYGINMIMAAALLPMAFAHLPKEKFGQLVSCQLLINQGLLFAGNLLVGLIITITGDDARVAFIYGGIIYLLSPLFLFIMLHCRNPFAGEATSMSVEGKR